MQNFHIVWTDWNGVERMTSITAESFEDACRNIGCNPDNSREDDFGVSWETYEIDNTGGR